MCEPVCGVAGDKRTPSRSSSPLRLGVDELESAYKTGDRKRFRATLAFLQHMERAMSPTPQLGVSDLGGIDVLVTPGTPWFGELVSFVARLRSEQPHLQHLPGRVTLPFDKYRRGHKQVSAGQVCAACRLSTMNRSRLTRASWCSSWSSI